MGVRPSSPPRDGSELKRDEGQAKRSGARSGRRPRSKQEKPAIDASRSGLRASTAHGREEGTHMKIDLDREPLSISVVEHDNGKISFSDVPDRLIPALVQAYGHEKVAKCISPTKPEQELWMSLPVMKPQPFPRF